MISTSPIDRELSLGRVPAFEGHEPDRDFDYEREHEHEDDSELVVEELRSNSRQELERSRAEMEKEYHLLSQEAETLKKQLAEESKRKSVRIASPEVSEKYEG